MVHKKHTGKKALAKLNFVAYVNIFMKPTGYDKIPLCNTLYFVRGTGLLAE
jgi:hypothetical protein